MLRLGIKTFTGIAKFSNRPYDLAIWTGVLKSSLTADQYQTYENACRDRNSHFLATAVHNAICELDTIATLQQVQRNKLTKIAISELEKNIDVHSPKDLMDASKLATEFFGVEQNLALALTAIQIDLITMHRKLNYTAVGWGENHWNFHNREIPKN